MNSDRPTGVLLIAGAGFMLAAIAAHPHHAQSESHVDARGTNLVVAVLVLFSLAITGVGLLRLLRHLPQSLLRDVTSIVLVLAAACCSLAAINGHIAIPNFVHGLETNDASQKAIADVVLTYGVSLGAALAKTMFAAWAVGLLILSITVLKESAVGKLPAVYGICFAVCLLFLLFSDSVSMSLHDVGFIVLASAIWLIATGVALCRRPERTDESELTVA